MTHGPMVLGAGEEETKEDTDATERNQLLGPLGRVQRQPQDQTQKGGQGQSPAGERQAECSVPLFPANQGPDGTFMEGMNGTYRAAGSLCSPNSRGSDFLLELSSGLDIPQPQPWWPRIHRDAASRLRDAQAPGERA